MLFLHCVQVVPRVKELANDSSQFVRAALAGVVMELAPQLGKQPTIEHLVPVFLNLLRDPYPDVRLNVISKLDQVKAGAHRWAPARSSYSAWTGSCVFGCLDQGWRFLFALCVSSHAGLAMHCVHVEGDLVSSCFKT